MPKILKKNAKELVLSVTHIKNRNKRKIDPKF